MAEDYYAPNMSDNGTVFVPMEDPYLVWPIKHILIIIYSAAFILGLAGNLLVLFVIVRNKSMQTVTNFFLANLAVADLLVVICCIIPKLLWYITPSWPLGAVMCKLHLYMISATSCASIFILTVISVERFIAIIFPLKTRQLLTAPNLIVVISFVWVSSAAFNVPTILMNTVIVHQANEYCVPTVSTYYLKIYTVICLVVFYTFPLLVMTILYGLICRKLWVSTANLHASSENGSKHAENERFWTKIPSKVRYFVNSRGKNCKKDGDELDDLGKSVNKKYAECDDEVQILMEPPVPQEGIPEDKSERVGRFLLDEPSDETEATCSITCSSKYNEKHTNGPENVPLNKCQQVSEPDNDVDDSRTVKCNTQNSLPTSQQKTNIALAKAGTPNNKKVPKKKSKREENLAKRKKVIRLLVAIVISFALCLFPTQLYAGWGAFGSPPQPTLGQQLAVPLSIWFYFLNSVLNPFLYAFLSDNFRKKMRDSLLPKSAQRRKEQDRFTGNIMSRSTNATETETMH